VCGACSPPARMCFVLVLPALRALRGDAAFGCTTLRFRELPYKSTSGSERRGTVPGNDMETSGMTARAWAFGR
jgi:hypothetical protein